jgi:isochorismate synthase
MSEISGIAVFRQPYSDEVTLVIQNEGTPVELFTCADLNNRSGFVIAPFEVKPEQPILLIRPDRKEQMPLSALSTLSLEIPATNGIGMTGATRMHYAIDFANEHSQLELGTFQKIVLARCVDEKPQDSQKPLDFFLQACELYPRLFIALVWTAKSGCWLTATPEILLKGEGTAWQTVALAGTMKLEGEQLKYDAPLKDVPITWTTKNIKEQRMVATYIAECLEQYASDFSEEGPSTVRAANLVHLRSDFSFTLPDNTSIGNLLQSLHPTPAVCGLPKKSAFDFIVRHEHTPRRYYSGFMGMLDPQAQTFLYVSLRCMNIEQDVCHLYAGGGLLKDSVEEQEWQETEAKLDTMRRCIAIRNK